jgi:hypothetical protein
MAMNVKRFVTVLNSDVAELFRPVFHHKTVPLSLSLRSIISIPEGLERLWDNLMMEGNWDEVLSF